jgi:hypothetical protein
MNNVPLELRDIHDVPPPGFWPPAPGWWVLALLVLLALIGSGRWLFQRYSRWRRQRRALITLASIYQAFAQDHNASRFAAEASILMRRVALLRFPRRNVAGLSGANWLAFLDETGGKGEFGNGPGSVLKTAPYMPTTELDAQGLYTLVKNWIKQNI